MTHKALRCVVTAAAVLLLQVAPASAAGCAFESLGEGRVATVIDARTFRLDDGREVRLAGIEAAVPDKTRAIAALTAIIGGRGTARTARRTATGGSLPSPSSPAPRRRCRANCCGGARRWFRPR